MTQLKVGESIKKPLLMPGEFSTLWDHFAKEDIADVDKLPKPLALKGRLFQYLRDEPAAVEVYGVCRTLTGDVVLISCNRHTGATTAWNFGNPMEPAHYAAGGGA